MYRRLAQRAWMLLQYTVQGFIQDEALTRGAAIAFYTVTSMAPVLVITIAIAGLFFGQDAARGALVDELGNIMGPQAAGVLQAVVANAANPTLGTIAGVLGLLTLLIAASGVFGEMQNALNRIWRLEAEGDAITRVVRARMTNLILVGSLGFLLLLSLAISAVLGAVTRWIDPQFSLLRFGTQLVNYVVSFGMTTLVFGTIYKVLPQRSLHWRDVLVGAFATAILFLAGKTGISLYLSGSRMGSSYGAAGALIILLLWVYYTAQIFLVGAEFTHAWARLRAQGWQPEAEKPAASAGVAKTKSSDDEKPASTTETVAQITLPGP